MDHLILARRPELVLINKKKIIWHIVDFNILLDHRVKIKGNKKIDKYFDFAETKKSCGT